MSYSYFCGTCAQSAPLFNRAAVQWTVRSPRWLLSHQSVPGSICAVDQCVFPIPVFSTNVSSLSRLFPGMSLQTLQFVCMAAVPRQLCSVFRNMWSGSSLPRSTHQAPERTLSVILPEKGRWANRHSPFRISKQKFYYSMMSLIFCQLFAFSGPQRKKNIPHQCVMCW